MTELGRELDLALERLQRRRKRRHLAFRLALLLLIPLAGALVIPRWIGLCVVEGASMSPALQDGDVLLFHRTGGLPQYGELLLLELEDGSMAVKRAAGLPGDRIEVSPEGRLTRNGQEVPEEYAVYGLQDTTQWIAFPYTVPEGSVFYLGDNRPWSLDSRINGAAPEESVLGTVAFSLRGAP